jgi:hypothetical protein
MFEAEIERTKIRLAEQLLPKTSGGIYLADVLDHVDVDRAYKEFFRAEVEWLLYQDRIQRQLRLPIDSRDPLFRRVWGQVEDYIRGHAWFDRSHALSLLDAAVKSVLNYRVRPRVTLKWFVYRGEPTKPVCEILLRLRYFADYAYLRTGFEQWMHERGLEPTSTHIMPVFEFERLVKQLDDEHILDLSTTQFIELLDPVFHFFNEPSTPVSVQTIPIEALIVFLDDKDIQVIAQKFERMLYHDSIRAVTRDTILRVVDQVLQELELEQSGAQQAEPEASAESDQPHVDESPIEHSQNQELHIASEHKESEFHIEPSQVPTVFSEEPEQEPSASNIDAPVVDTGANISDEAPGDEVPGDEAVGLELDISEVPAPSAEVTETEAQQTEPESVTSSTESTVPLEPIDQSLHQQEEQSLHDDQEQPLPDSEQQLQHDHDEAQPHHAPEHIELALHDEATEDLFEEGQAQAVHPEPHIFDEDLADDLQDREQVADESVEALPAEDTETLPVEDTETLPVDTTEELPPVEPTITGEHAAIPDRTIAELNALVSTIEHLPQSFQTETPEQRRALEREFLLPVTEDETTTEEHENQSHQAPNHEHIVQSRESAGKEEAADYALQPSSIDEMLESGLHHVRVRAPLQSAPAQSLIEFLDKDLQQSVLKKLCGHDQFRYEGLMARLNAASSVRAALNELDRYLAEYALDPTMKVAQELRLALVKRYTLA